MNRLLFVDDEQTIRLTLSTILHSKGFDVTTAASVKEALHLIDTQRFDVLLSDLNIGEPGDGFTIVSAMRRIQPEACTFILTGYPDFETALRAIRNQVDDYFTKPADINALVGRLLERVATPRSANPPLPIKRVADVLREQTGNIVERWYETVEEHPELSAIRLDKAARIDHVPDLITELIGRIERPTEDTSPHAIEDAKNHGRLRYQQGYEIPQIVVETRILQQTLTAVLKRNLLGIDLSNLIHDLLEIGETLNILLEVSIRAHQSEIPSSLQE